MKKTFILVLASIAWTACGGTVALEEQSQLQTKKQATGTVYSLEDVGLTCGMTGQSPNQQACLCQASQGGCGWTCTQVSTATETYYVTYTMACDPGGFTCLRSSHQVRCDSPCVIDGSFSENSCAGTLVY
jgi:hypothetical protein